MDLDPLSNCVCSMSLTMSAPPAVATRLSGLIYYLPEAAVHRLIASVGRLAAPGSRLYFDYMQAAALRGTKGDASWVHDD